MELDVEIKDIVDSRVSQLVDIVLNSMAVKMQEASQIEPRLAKMLSARMLADLLMGFVKNEAAMMGVNVGTSEIVPPEEGPMQ